jgi:hypothetical protein
VEEVTMRHAGLAFLLFACLPVRAFADEAQVDQGDRVRVSTRSVDKKTGVVEAATPDAIQVRLDGDVRSLEIPVAELTRIEISQGPRGRCAAAWSKGKWGALIGAVPGAISLALQHEQVGEDGSSAGEAALLGAWSGGLFGGLIGALIGAANPGEAWEKVSLSPAIELGIEGRGGFSFSLTVGF